MDRNKRPALTSPWKIGFLVSLFLVTVGIGVGFSITRTFNITWSWIKFGERTWAIDSWVFDYNAFMSEMLPLIILVPVMSLLAYFLITGAVRKYKAFLDSGFDYKNLVQSIKRIDDLQEERIKSLSNYPELRDFLLKIKNGIDEKEKSHQEREKALDSRGRQISNHDQFKAEAGVLVGAINQGAASGFTEELALSVPELKQIENAIRQQLLGSQTGATSFSASDLGEQFANLREELVGSADVLTQMLSEISSEMGAGRNAAREIESLLSQAKSAIASGSARAETGGGVDASAATALIGRLDQTSNMLMALSEETKGVAINTALQAGGGQGEAAGVVQLADDVRDLANKFNGVAAQYNEVGLQLKAAVQALEGPGDTGQIRDAIETMHGKATLWMERAMILGEKLNIFEQQLADTRAVFEAKLGGATDHGEMYQTADLAGEDSGELGETDIQGGTKPEDDFVRQPGRDSVLETGAARPSAPERMAGLEQNKNLFEEISGQTDDNLFADIPPAPGPQQPAEQPPAEPTDVKDTSTELFEEMAQKTPPAQQSEPGQFIQSQVDLSGVEVESTTVPGSSQAERDVPQSPPAPRVDSPAVPGQTDEEPVFNLYELGAVDYEPSIHQNA